MRYYLSQKGERKISKRLKLLLKSEKKLWRENSRNMDSYVDVKGLDSAELLVQHRDPYLDPQN